MRILLMQYERLWVARSSVGQFADEVSDEWSAEYVASTGADPQDLVKVDPGNGFTYLFDLAGSLRDEPCSWVPRVLGVSGLSRADGPTRDRSRMRGHPRPRRNEDDRGHLIACASGGGYDINLVPMDAGLNRGRSAEGERFRAMERRAADVPGALFFIRPVYHDDTDRPWRFEVGVQIGDALLTDNFLNSSNPTSPMGLAVLRQTAALAVDAQIVAGCIDPTAPGDALFLRGWRLGPADLTRAEQCAVAGVTGHVAESVTEVLLDDLGWRVIWHFVGPGRHGVDLVFLSPDEKVVALEVKGTLVSGRIPRLSRREVAQMSSAWVDKADNPGMADLGLQSADIYGGVVLINFADLTWRVAFTADFAELRPVETVEQIAALDWLAAA